MSSFRILRYSVLCGFIASIVFLFASGCKKDELNTEKDFRLTFSTDTVLFDTVFSTIGTATQKLLVHNTSNKKVIVSSVRLAGGESSPYRINIDGVPAYIVNDLEIDANDSIYIFVKVTIDPSNQDNPLIRTDSIVFETNGHLQDVKLVAWGQDAIFYNNETLSGSITLREGKPHVIYGILKADSTCNLSIEAGARLYFHDKSGLIIQNGASVQVNGTLEKPVKFRGDRLDDFYSNIPGQWLGIELEGESHDNYFSYADIQNGQVGLWVDSSSVTDVPKVKLYNCIISNMVNYGIIAVHTHIQAANCQVTNCGGYTLAIQNGGRCDFRHCTISNYWSTSARHFPTLLLSNYMYYDDGTKLSTPLENAYFGNCIINGSNYEELEADKSDAVAFNVTFDHCLVQTSLDGTYASSFNNCLVNKEAKFMDAWEGNFQLDTLSAAKDAGILPVIQTSPLNVTLDLKGISRISDAAPDLGTYERVEKR